MLWHVKPYAASIPHTDSHVDTKSGSKEGGERYVPTYYYDDYLPKYWDDYWWDKYGSRSWYDKSWWEKYFPKNWTDDYLYKYGSDETIPRKWPENYLLWKWREEYLKKNYPSYYLSKKYTDDYSSKYVSTDDYLSKKWPRYYQWKNWREDYKKWREDYLKSKPSTYTSSYYYHPNYLWKSYWPDYYDSWRKYDTSYPRRYYGSYPRKYYYRARSASPVNGRYSPRSRSMSPTRSLTPGVRPSVDNLLDDLQSAVPRRSPSPRGRPYSPSTSASSATRELDDLMSSLSDFKLNSPSYPQESSYGKTQRSVRSPSYHINQLDSMLGTLQSDMNKQGVNTTAKGHCAACAKPIVGQVVTALGKTWHPEHFTCAHCNKELGTKNFYERNGQPYCEEDYHNIFSPKCAYCTGAILDKCVTALDKTWHPDHFFCAQCGKAFGEGGFHEKDGKAYCRDDYLEMFAPKCGGCNRPIVENYISALNTQWHPDCFVCRDCRQGFNGGSFYDHEGQPYCETHYHAKRGSLCAGCHKPITGRCITAMFRKFHPEHFVCSFCLKQLNKGTFKEQNDKPYCHNCFEKLFG